MEKNQILDVIAYLGLTVDSVFIPLSRSRNKSEAGLTLNWIVTLSRNGKQILSTDYSAGMAHCPSYNRKVPATWDKPNRLWRGKACAAECESGFANNKYSNWSPFTPNRELPIRPDTIDVIYSLVSESNALDYASFEGWACVFGYDEDSRKGELIYRACLEIAIKLRIGIGENDLCLLQDTLEDY
jgi:hypothetical protein